MDTQYYAFAREHAHYYERPGSTHQAETYAIDQGLNWNEWGSGRSGSIWIGYHHPTRPLADQGWKIHVSATHDNAQRLLTAVSRYCHTHRLPFKHLADAGVLHRTNLKYADRAASGKFITIYPATTEESRRTLAELDRFIGGETGPYILSDLRYNRGPLYVRYGAYTLTHTLEDGASVPAITDSDGAPQPDRREPRFIVPDWVDTPDFIAAQLNALSDDGPESFPYRIERALHHSNGGGIYEARDGSDNLVILKEARPHAGLSPDRSDAVTRLRNEERILEQLADIPGIVRYRGSFDMHGHRFAVLDRADGDPLHAHMTRKMPAIRTGTSSADYLEYRNWAFTIIEHVETTLAAMHAAGISYGDLHPGNIIVSDDDTVTFIDLETAHSIDQPPLHLMGAPGYMAPDGRRGAAADRYSLACLKLAIFLPLTVLLPLDPDKVTQLISWADERFDLPLEYRQSITRDLTDRTSNVIPFRSAVAEEARGRLKNWRVRNPSIRESLMDDLAASIAHSADLGRNDRAYPADIAVFQHGDTQPATTGLGLAHGATGVLTALRYGGQILDPYAIEWLKAQVETTRAAAAQPTSTLDLGLVHGIGGTVWGLRRLGMIEPADRLSQLLLAPQPENFSNFSDDLSTGLAGYAFSCWAESDALTLTDITATAVMPWELPIRERFVMVFEEEDDERQELAGKFDARGNHAYAELVRRFEELPLLIEPTPAETGKAGLLHGTSGIALAALIAFERTQDEQHLDLARRALDRDLAHCITQPDGSLQVNEGWRSMPYLATGSAGIGLVLLRFIENLGGIAETPVHYLAALDGILRAAQTDFTIQSGLWNGRAGLMVLLADAIAHGHDSQPNYDALRHHASELRLHALQHGPGIAFAGDQLLRISSDLATGTAGVLIALESYHRVEGRLEEGPRQHPFFKDLIPE